MERNRGSRTAERVAERRAAHQLFDRPLVFADPLAVAITGRDAADLIADQKSPLDPFLRAAFAVRSRFAEDELREAVGRGVRQYVVLGAGFDTFAYRNPFPELRVFEVDHPATQAVKRARLDAAGIAVPPNGTFIAIDFASMSLADALAELRGPAFFSWLGVVPYLETAAIEATFRYVSSRPAGSAIVFDYGTKPESLSVVGRMIFNRMAARVAAVGEPWKTFFDSDELVALLRACGFAFAETCGPAELNRRYFSGREDGLRIGEMMQMAKAFVA